MRFKFWLAFLSLNPKPMDYASFGWYASEAEARRVMGGQTVAEVEVEENDGVFTIISWTWLNDSHAQAIIDVLRSVSFPIYNKNAAGLQDIPIHDGIVYRTVRLGEPVSDERVLWHLRRNLEAAIRLAS
ncbi:MAG: hypothetical protein ABIH41_06025 [Nanoarchaeota archaeon]